MKKIKYLILSILMTSCGVKSTKTSAIPPLFEVLTQQSDGGANIHFFEILTEPNEIRMLQNDPYLKNKISAADVQKSNFLILNMGEKPTGGYTIGIESVEQVGDSIAVKVKEESPEEGAMVTQAITFPYCIVKINSKKGIRIK